MLWLRWASFPGLVDRDGAELLWSEILGCEISLTEGERSKLSTSVLKCIRRCLQMPCLVVCL